MKLILIATALLTLSMPAESKDFSAFTALLADHVHDGKVSYPALCKDPRFTETLRNLSAINPELLKDRNEALAVWINAYNAWTLKAVCDAYPVKSINDLNTGGRIVSRLLKTTIWDKPFVEVPGGRTTLNHIEHDIIRKQFHEPRAHFALVCASKSCPPLRSEAYEGQRLNEQLEDQGKAFFSDAARNSIDAGRKIARLSKILDWYGGDFGKTTEERLIFVARFLPPALAESIRSDSSGWKVEFLPYDWSLNE